MADPVTLTALITGGLTAGATVMQAQSQSETLKAQASNDQAKAATEQQWATRRANEERASAQAAAGEEHRKATMAQSRLGAVAGASGSSASDPTVMNLWKGIETEGTINAGRVQAGGEQKAQGIEYQSALDRWSADSNAAIKRSAAKSTLIGGILSAGGQMGQTAMSARYRTAGSGVQRTGY